MGTNLAFLPLGKLPCSSQVRRAGKKFSLVSVHRFVGHRIKIGGCAKRFDNNRYYNWSLGTERLLCWPRGPATNSSIGLFQAPCSDSLVSAPLVCVPARLLVVKCTSNPGPLQGSSQHPNASQSLQLFRCACACSQIAADNRDAIQH